MILKQGKFYDDTGNVVPLEFGNKEQLDILSRVEIMRSEGEFLEQDFFTNKQGTRIIGTWYAWDCICGSKVTAHIHDKMEGRKYKCRTCGMRYQIDYSLDFDSNMVYLKS